MKVELIAHTPNPDHVCAVASSTCVSQEIPNTENVVLGSLKGALASGHESVAEHASFTFAIEGVSRALTHQLVRHRIASYSQQSQRYVKMDGFEYVTPKSILNPEDEEEVHFSFRWCHDKWIQVPVDRWIAYTELMDDIRKLYNELVNAGIPEEDARYILPNACTTNIVVTMNARELRHFFNLRCCTRAQWEIRALADAMLAEVKKVAPALFKGAGASCVATGRCPEGKKSCGKVKKSQNESD